MKLDGYVVVILKYFLQYADELLLILFSQSAFVGGQGANKNILVSAGLVGGESGESS